MEAVRGVPAGLISMAESELDFYIAIDDGAEVGDIERFLEDIVEAFALIFFQVFGSNLVAIGDQLDLGVGFFEDVQQVADVNQAGHIEVSQNQGDG